LTAPAAGYSDVTVTAGQNSTGHLFADAPATASIAGRVFGDVNGNGVRDTHEPGLGLFTVYLDLNGDGRLDTGDVSATTDINGNFKFTGLTAGTYKVRVVAVSGFTVTHPTGGAQSVTLAAGQASTSTLFGEQSMT